ncbi:monooxygenase [Aspergillus eucalypticola CBS 122712]|uniref:Monooxygenase n=1 Tax=Aspergillus eucalypticola (strain CBS 122712 / IBT 29274) TaxID=1448314 RepID=A0A317W885_ASPEC|nr:monooxygenase [Aspergillus eucalypticola CBS 122712]PWY82319.1 monooxygenase [Aspergillus eucalypticola CBS 122712]
MALRPCKVIVAGGGVAGLSLALMLEKHGIDYLLLEAYPQVLATVGAGIALAPNGLRIIEQLGCYEDLQKCSAGADQVHFRKPDGETLWGMDEGLAETCIAKCVPLACLLPQLSNEYAYQGDRHGYTYMWMDRKSLLEVLYNNIADKSKVLPGKRVASVTHTDNGVDVVTTDGYAEDLGLSEDYAEEDKVAASYSCVFGMSDPVPGFPSRSLEFVTNEGFSYVLGAGPAGRVYWFLMEKMKQTYYGADIPRFSEEDKQRTLQEHWNDQVTPNVRLSDLYKRQLSTIYTPMPEFVYKKWHLGRIITIGDACHKVLPTTAQGGNQALESAAAVVNGLMAALSQASGSGPLSQSEIQLMFERVQNIREPRTFSIIETTHKRQKLDTMDTPELKEFLLTRYAGLMPGELWKR